MIEFQCEPDPIFLAIVSAALSWTREQLYPFLETARPTAEDMQELDENYSNSLYPRLAQFLSRTDAVAQVGRLADALAAPGLHRITDYHWLVLHESLLTFCELHNDGALAADVGPYVVDKIDFEFIIERFFFDMDFLFGADFLIADERRAHPMVDVSPQARRIAAGLKPAVGDLDILPIADDASTTEPATQPLRPYPNAGYIGPYPMREPSADEA